MGAEYQYRTFKSCDEKKLLSLVSDAIDESRMMDGIGGYSGTWAEKGGCQIARMPMFESFNDAEEWVGDNNDKWGDLVAVKYKCKTKTNVSSNQKKIDKLAAKIDEIEVQVNGFGHTVLTRVKAGKSKTKSCGKCDSKISTRFLRQSHCPVCCETNFIFSDTDKKKLEGLRNKHTSLKKELTTLKQLGTMKTVENDNDWAWFVGGFCSC